MVEAGMLIGHVVPVPDSRDRIDLERDVEATRVALEYAELERDRVAPLAADGILSEARRNETDAAVAAAEVAHDGARRRLSNWSAVERGDSNGSRIAITAPIGGRISDSMLIDGAYVSADEDLARITDVARAVIEAHIPETDVGRIPLLTSAIVYVASSETPIEVSLDTPPIPAGRVDPATHTLAIRFALPEFTTVPASGLSARVMFGEGAVREVVAVPRSAVSDEDGIPVVYVQTSGEEFARRTVRTGERDGEYVEIVTGVSAGEWVVTEGAWLVRLAASQGAMPSHGHAH
jgi:RND family efflux transporter MFP subunit